MSCLLNTEATGSLGIPTLALPSSFPPDVEYRHVLTGERLRAEAGLLRLSWAFATLPLALLFSRER